MYIFLPKFILVFYWENQYFILRLCWSVYGISTSTHLTFKFYLIVEDDDDEDEETCSEDETSNKTMYTAISNTPTRITLLSNSSQQSTQGALKNKNRRANKVTKKKVRLLLFPFYFLLPFLFFVPFTNRLKEEAIKT